ncbi:MAG: hypothetical protein JKY09_03910 [Crocinitomicaceae bacterium]|nr:hypothetical protein [Crocinitomicaceae bacterium]
MSEVQQDQRKNNGAFIVIIIILLLGLAVMSYLWSGQRAELNVCENANRELRSDMKGMNEMLSGYVGGITNDLKSDFQSMLDTYDALIEKDASKAEELNSQKEEIQGLMDELDKNKNISAYRISQLKRENDELRNIMKGYVYEIDSLRTLNLSLYNDLDSTNTALTNTKTERDEFKTQAEESAALVKKGAKLQAYGFSSGGLKMKLNNTTTATTKARNVVQIKSTFTIGKNPITVAGNKTVYMQVVDPQGKTYQSSPANVLQTDSGQVPFSDKKDIDYNNQSIDVSVFYSLRGAKVTKGNYKVRIYCQGQLIGSDSFTLK